MNDREQYQVDSVAWVLNWSKGIITRQDNTCSKKNKIPDIP